MLGGGGVLSADRRAGGVNSCAHLYSRRAASPLRSSGASRSRENTRAEPVLRSTRPSAESTHGKATFRHFSAPIPPSRARCVTDAAALRRRALNEKWPARLLVAVFFFLSFFYARAASAQLRARTSRVLRPHGEVACGLFLFFRISRSGGSRTRSPDGARVPLSGALG